MVHLLCGLNKTSMNLYDQLNKYFHTVTTFHQFPILGFFNRVKVVTLVYVYDFIVILNNSKVVDDLIK